MKYTLPAANWSSQLAEILGKSEDGDVIVVASESAKALAERAKSRMCPTKNIVIEVES